MEMTRTESDSLIEAFKSALSYDPETGLLSWRERPASDHQTRTWNTRYAGKAITCLDRHGYIQLRFRGKVYRAHRVIWAITYGYWPEDDLDHINGVRSENKLANLREATRSQNNYNRRAPSAGRFHRGVTLHKASGLYRAYIVHDGRQISLGYHKTEAAAREAYLSQAPGIVGPFLSARSA